MLNLNNEVFGFYNGSEQFPIQREYYNRTISAGLRWTPFDKETPMTLTNCYLTRYTLSCQLTHRAISY